MNYTVIKALNTLAGSNSTFNTTISAVGTGIKALDANFVPDVQNVLLAIQGGHNGYTNNLTTLGDGAFAAAMANVSNSTAVSFTKTSEHKYILANTLIPGPQSLKGDVTVQGTGDASATGHDTANGTVSGPDTANGTAPGTV